MPTRPLLLLALLALGLPRPATGRPAPGAPGPDDDLVQAYARERLALDHDVMVLHRPSYAFWEQVFLIPDGSIAFGSARDGHLLARFPVKGDWRNEGSVTDPAAAAALARAFLPDRLDDRRDQVARLLEPDAGSAVHNPTRGGFLRPGARRYGAFLGEWGAIYERFGVPAEIGLAQAVVESGLAGKVRSEAGAVGFCQWLPRNWDRLKRMSGRVIEAENQTTQAAYCAAYLTVLATKYGSFIPALSEHHAGDANVGRTLINGARLGAADVRERYFVGADFARDLRTLSPRAFRDVIGTFGPRSYVYAEMVFGNQATVEQLRAGTPQRPVYAMRAPRDIPLGEVVRRSGLTADEVKRYNPALVRRVPRGADVYLPAPLAALGPDVSFWHRPPPPTFSATLAEFLHLGVTPERWEDPAFEPVLQDFRRRFRATKSEEGAVMATVLGYVIQDLPNGRRVLADYRGSPRLRRSFEEAVRVRNAQQQ